MKPNKAITLIENILYVSRWLLVPMYLGLIIGLFRYCLSFLQELLDMFGHESGGTEQLMLALLGLVDITMVGNLVNLISIGSYSIFVKPIVFASHDEQPKFLHSITSGTLKVKMSMSLVGISSVHLLKDFMNAEIQDWNLLSKRILLHVVFVLSTLGMVVVEKMLHKSGEH